MYNIFAGLFCRLGGFGHKWHYLLFCLVTSLIHIMLIFVSTPYGNNDPVLKKDWSEICLTCLSKRNPPGQELQYAQLKDSLRYVQH